MTAIAELRTRSCRLFRVFLFENWKFLACWYLIIRYLNQFQRCGNRSFPNCIIFHTSLFSLYLRKFANNSVIHTQKIILAKFYAIFQVILRFFDHDFQNQNIFTTILQWFPSFLPEQKIKRLQIFV